MTNTGRSRFIASQGGFPIVLYPTDQFPTIASIPTGAVVYDTTDGVVKKKVGDYLVDIQYNVIGYGPIASAPTASEGNNGAFWLETGNPLWPNGRLWGYRRGLQNSGSDRVTLPAEINAIIALSESFAIVAFAQVESTTGTCHIICKGPVRAEAKQVGIVMYTGSFYGQIGGVSSSSITATTEHKRLVLSNYSGSAKISDGTDVASFTAGAVTATTPLMLLAASDAYSVNRFKLFGVEVYNSANADGTTVGLSPLAKWALDEPAGSTQLIDSVGGLVADVADGSPLGCVGTPMLVPFQW